MTVIWRCWKSTKRRPVIHGRVVNARAVLTFEGETLAEPRAAFAETIADCRDWRRERGVEPEKPCSGTPLRIAPELHRRVAEQAAKARGERQSVHRGAVGGGGVRRFSAPGDIARFSGNVFRTQIPINSRSVLSASATSACRCSMAVEISAGER